MPHDYKIYVIRNIKDGVLNLNINNQICDIHGSFHVLLDMPENFQIRIF